MKSFYIYCVPSCWGKLNNHDDVKDSELIVNAKKKKFFNTFFFFFFSRHKILGVKNI